MSIAIFGSTGFVGSNFVKKSNNLELVNFTRKEVESLSFSLKENIQTVLNFVGKAHDLQDFYIDSDYYEINTKFCIDLFDKFLKSEAEVFITISSVKAVIDEIDIALTEELEPNPLSKYGKSKLAADNYILNQKIPFGKRFYILRPCIIYGSGNKGNLNLLYNFVKFGIPWPLGKYDNQKSFCSVDNLIFVINHLIKDTEIPSGIYNIADDEPLSTNELISLIAQSQNRKPRFWKIPKGLIELVSAFGDKLQLPLNTERLKKLTSSYVVSNAKIKLAIGKQLPVSTRDGLLNTFKSFYS